MYPIVKINYTAPAMNIHSRKCLINQIPLTAAGNEMEYILHFFTDEPGSCIAHYFRFSITFSTMLIHYYAPHRCDLPHKLMQSLMCDALTFASSDQPCLIDGHMMYDSHVYSSPFSYFMHPPVANQSWIIMPHGQALTIASLWMSLVLAFLFTICI